MFWLCRIQCLSRWLITIIATSLGAFSAHAGGGPENVFLVVNASSAASLAVANAFIALREVPPINVFAIAWDGPDDAVPSSVFREQILSPVLTAIDARGLAPQIDCIAYSCGFPWRIDFRDDLPEPLAARDKYPAGSLTGMTFLFSATLEPPVGSVPRWLSRHANRYAPPPPPDGSPPTTRGFRAATGWGPDGEPAEAGGSHHVLAVMLGVTAGRGNSVAEICSSLTASTAADGSQPAGTIYLVRNADVRSTTRSAGFESAAAAIREAGAHAEIITGILPQQKPDVAGLTTGTADFDWPTSGSRLLPGAICDNLTSFGGVFTPGAGQTPLAEFIRAGAAGASGTVIEPYALAEKFPAPSLHVHYTRGACLAEAFYRSVQSPYQLLVVGDPLCQPWARVPAVDVTITADPLSPTPLDLASPLSGTVSLLPQGTPTGPAPIERYELFVDGIRLATGRDGDPLSLDTSRLSDGYHELRVVAIESSPLKTQGRWVRGVKVANHGHQVTLSTVAREVTTADTVTLHITGSEADAVTIFTAGRVLKRLTPSGPAVVTDIAIPAAVLGSGVVTLHATAFLDGIAIANATPVTVHVTDQPPAPINASAPPPEAGGPSR
jgi:hypothetical protein